MRSDLLLGWGDAGAPATIAILYYIGLVCGKVYLNENVAVFHVYARIGV